MLFRNMEVFVELMTHSYFNTSVGVGFAEFEKNQIKFQLPIDKVGKKWYYSNNLPNR